MQPLPGLRRRSQKKTPWPQTDSVRTAISIWTHPVCDVCFRCLGNEMPLGSRKIFPRKYSEVPHYGRVGEDRSGQAPWRGVQSPWLQGTEQQAWGHHLNLTFPGAGVWAVATPFRVKVLRWESQPLHQHSAAFCTRQVSHGQICQYAKRMATWLNPTVMGAMPAKVPFPVRQMVGHLSHLHHWPHKW